MLLLLSVLSYSQTVLIDNSGDTSICISISQMDRIYTELMQKDSLLSQSRINASKESLMVNLLDSAGKDISVLKMHLMATQATNLSLATSIELKQVQIRRNRNISIIAVLVLTLSILIK